jgi:hypothetical protein
MNGPSNAAGIGVDDLVHDFIVLGQDPFAQIGWR